MEKKITTAIGEIVIYTNADGTVQTEVCLVSESLWLSLNQIAALFERDKSVVSRHIRNIYKEGELEQNPTVANFATVQTKGSRQIERQIEYYNLDVIISVGYRVKSLRYKTRCTTQPTNTPLPKSFMGASIAGNRCSGGVGVSSTTPHFIAGLTTPRVIAGLTTPRVIAGLTRNLSGERI